MPTQADGIAARVAEAKALIGSARFAEAERVLDAALAEAGRADDARGAAGPGGATGAGAARADLLYALAVARRYGGRAAAALEAADDLLTLRADYGRAHQERGYALRALERGDEASAAFGAAVRCNPGLAASWKALAELHEAAGRGDAAHFARAQAEYLEALPVELRHVTDLLHEGRLDQADRLCRKFLRAHRHHIDAMRLLAEIGVRLRVYDDAEFVLESAVELAPGHARARLDYAGILNRKGRFEPALEQARILLAEQPENPAFALAAAHALVGLGQLDEAIALYRRCLGLGHGDPAIHVAIGHAEKARGDIEAAVAAYRAAYACRPDYGDAYWSLANTKTYEFTAAELDAIAQREADAATAHDDRVQLCFAAGKAYEDRGSYDAAFEYYARGNALKRARLNYDPDRIDALVDAQIATCTPELFEARRGVGCPAPDPIFIVGLPRAGSTLLEQILASHSKVDGTMELHHVLGLAQRLGGHGAAGERKYPAILAELEPEYFERFGAQFLEHTRVYRGDAPFFIDKMPNNFMHLGLIRLILPNAKIIDARREPMACCFSGFKQLFGEGQDFSYGLDWIGRYYAAYVRLMDHWDAVLPGGVLRVMHEDVVEDLETQVRRLLDFCGLPFEAGCLAFHETRRSVRTPSSEQVRRPIYRSGTAQWRRFEAHLGPLREALGPDVRGRYPSARG